MLTQNYVACSGILCVKTTGENVRTTRIYQPGHYKKGDTVELSTQASQHVGVVLRMRVGESLILFCGDSREFPATVLSVQKKLVTVFINEEHIINRESPCDIHLAQAISKGERMEFVIQKAVELGVTRITPLITQHCVVRLEAERLLKKQAQWQAIAIAACEQSGRNTLPIINPLCALDAFLQECQAPYKFVLHPHTNKTWRDYSFAKAKLVLLVGPEGGLSEEEIKATTSASFQPLSLGPRILRTETAALAALSILQALSGDL